MAKRKTDYVRQDPRNPKRWKYSIGSIGEGRQVFYREFDTEKEAFKYLQKWLKDYENDN